MSSLKLEKIELCSCNLLECLQLAYSGTLLQSVSSQNNSSSSTSTSERVGDDGADDDDNDARSNTTSSLPTSNTDIALERLFADPDRDSDVIFASLIRSGFRSTLVLATRKVNVFIATSSLFIAADVPRGTVGAQLKPVPSHCDGDYITDLRLLELVDKDIVVVLAVYSRGHLRAFDTNGRLLFTKRFADEPIHSVRIRSRNVQDGLFSRQPEDLSLFYGSGVVVLVTALELFSTICTRMHLLEQGKPIGDEEPSMPHRKWRLTGCGSILDAAVLGIRCSEVLQINNNALRAGDRQASTPTITTDIVTVGANPAVALFDATVESSFASAFSVAQVAAAKLTSAVVGYARSWWSSTPAAPAVTDAAATAAKKEHIEPANSVAMRCGLFDEPRRVHRIALSVTGHLAATCDSLGRVALLDVQHLAMVKLWKGYRDAQLQWLLSPNADAQFLLLHAPRRSQIEVWRTRHSSKPVATERIGRALLVRRNGAHLGAANRHGMSHQYAMMLRANGTIVLVGVGAKTTN